MTNPLEIAHAVCTQPYLLLLEEANTLLDDETQVSVPDNVYLLRKSTIVETTALRFSSIRRANIADYLSEGKII